MHNNYDNLGLGDFMNKYLHGKNWLKLSKKFWGGKLKVKKISSLNWNGGKTGSYETNENCEHI